MASDLPDSNPRLLMAPLSSNCHECVRLFIEHAPSALAMFDREMRYLAVSKRWIDDYGLAAEAVVGRSHYEVFPEIPDAWRDVHRRALAGETIRAQDSCFARRDGSTQWLNWEIRPWYTSAQAIGGVVLFTEDVTASKSASIELERHAARYRAVLGTTIEGFLLVRSEDGRISEVNDAYVQLSGYRRDELLAMRISDLDAQENHAEVAAHIARIKENGHDRFETVHRRKDGTLWPVEAAVTHTTTPEDLYFAFLLDITQRKQAQARVADHVTQLEQSMLATLAAVANMVEQRDPYTAGHERRTGIIAGDLAREMGRSAEQCRILELAGMVHDIGKIGVPVEILSKPGRLAAIEYELVKTHVERGYEILKDVRFPWPIADIIRQHHERMDGSGYPRNLRGDDILPEARILAVADVVESMGSHRPYRPALGLEEGVREIQNHRGVKFDAEVVDALVRLLKDKQYQLPR